MPPNSAEIPVLDNLRAVAAWSVCLYHFVCTTTGLIDPAGTVYNIFYFGKYGVHLFFIISGMVIPWALYRSQYHLQNMGRFMVKRLLRLEPPYLFSILLVLLVLYLRKFSPSYNHIDRPVEMKQILLHLGYLVPFFKDVSWLNNVYWTLAIEFQYYLLIGILYFLFISPRLTVRAIGYAILLGAPYAVWSGNVVPFWLPLFGVGIVLFQYHTKRIVFTEGLAIWALCLADLWYLHSAVTALVAVVGSLAIHFLFHHSNRVLSFLGKSSYSVYLIHPVLGATFVNVFSHYVSGSFSKFMLVLGGVAITFTGSYIMYLFVEKPSKKISSSFSYHKK